MVGRAPPANSEPPAERRRSLDHSDRRLPSVESSGHSEPLTPHAQLTMGAMERLAPVLYVRNYRSLRRRIAEKTSRPTPGRDLPRPSYTPQQRAELGRVYSRSRSRPLPAPSRLGGSRGVTPSSESPRTRDATPSTPERQVRRPLLPLWTPADITLRDDPLDVSRTADEGDRALLLCAEAVLYCWDSWNYIIGVLPIFTFLQHERLFL